MADILLKRKLKTKEEMSMNEKLVINTNLLRKESEFRTKSCVVEKAIAVSHDKFDNLKRHPLSDNDLIAENVDQMYCDSNNNYHCLLIYDKEQGDGLLIESEEASYARYAQYIPNAKLLYANHMQTQLQELKFCCPLKINRESEYWSDEEYEEISSYETSAYESEINRFIKDFTMPEEKERGLMNWYDKDNSVDQKIRSAFMSVAAWADNAYISGWGYISTCDPNGLLFSGRFIVAGC